MIQFKNNPCDSLKITSDYGYRIHPIKKIRQFHKGIDIGKLFGKNYIYTVESGRVLMQGWNSQRGNYVIIQHDGFATLYQHLASYNTKIDQKVNAGQIIGLMGKTGASTGVHLHFEVFIGRYLQGDNVDPENYLLRKEI